jgi:DNA processing protein
MDALDAALLWSHLNILNRDRYTAVCEVFGTLQEAAKHISPEFLQGLGCRNDTIERVLVMSEEFNASRVRAHMAKTGTQFLTLEDPAFPANVLDIPDAPVFLYARGDLSVLSQPSVAVVGTRKMSAYGKRLVEHFVPKFVRSGLVTVSGLALGIDTTVAEETLAVKGKTVAVVGHGLGSIYPKTNTKLADTIVATGGVILSEFSLFMPPDTYTFPARNRIIAALARGTLVLEAPAGSGALITADLAFDYNRPVWVAPGLVFDPNFEGSHQLISSDRAKLVTHPDEILRDLRIAVESTSQETSTFVPGSPEETALYTILAPVPQTIDDIVARSGMAAATVNATLTMMELTGGARNVGAGEWVRL